MGLMRFLKEDIFDLLSTLILCDTFDEGSNDL